MNAALLAQAPYWLPLNEKTIWVLPAVAVFVVSLGIAVARYWHETQKARLKAEVDRDALALKQSMVERGMSAEDIERVLQASPHGETQSQTAAPFGKRL